MQYRIVISVYDRKDEIIGVHYGETTRLMRPDELGLVVQLVMSDGAYAVATLHEENTDEIVYGIMLEVSAHGD